MFFWYCSTGLSRSPPHLVQDTYTTAINEDIEAGDLLNELNEFLIKDFEGVNMYLSAFCGMLNFNTNEFFYSNHGHPSQYIYKIASSDAQPLTSQTSLLGIPDKPEDIYQHRLDFNRGDRILLFTDGVIETKNAEGVEYGNRTLEDFMRANSGATAEEFNQKLFQKLSDFNQGKFADDIFILNMRINPAP